VLAQSIALLFIGRVLAAVAIGPSVPPDRRRSSSSTARTIAGAPRWSRRLRFR